MNLRLALAFLGSGILSACNGLFYYPDDVMYATPEQYGVAYVARRVTAEDGVGLQAWVLSPEGPPKGTVLHFHGNAQNMSAHFLFVSWLTQKGYRVITFDYRGYGQSEGKAERAGMVRDGKAMIEFLCRGLEFHDGPRFIFAQSIGGAVAVPALAAVPQHCIKALILESTFASYRAMARDKLALTWLTWPLQWPLSFLVSDSESPVDAIAELSLPLLMIHGDADPVVPEAHGRALFDAYPNPAKEWWSLAGAGHTAAFGAEDSAERERFVRYLERFNP